MSVDVVEFNNYNTYCDSTTWTGANTIGLTQSLTFDSEAYEQLDSECRLLMVTSNRN